MLSAQPAGPDLSLPKLKSTASMQGTRTNHQQSSINKPAPATAGHVSGRLGSAAKASEYASAIGYPPVGNRNQAGLQSAEGKTRDEVMNPDDSALGN